MQKRFLLILVILFTLLTACGSGSSKKQPITTPTVETSNNVTQSQLPMAVVNLTADELNFNVSFSSVTQSSSTVISPVIFGVAGFSNSSDVFQLRSNESLDLTIKLPGTNDLVVDGQDANTKETVATIQQSFTEHAKQDERLVVVNYSQYDQQNKVTKISAASLSLDFDLAQSNSIEVDVFDLTMDLSLTIEGQCTNNQEADVSFDAEQSFHALSCSKQTDLSSMEIINNGVSQVLDYPFMSGEKYNLLISHDDTGNIITLLLATDSF